MSEKSSQRTRNIRPVEPGTMHGLENFTIGSTDMDENGPLAPEDTGRDILRPKNIWGKC